MTEIETKTEGEDFSGDISDEALDREDGRFTGFPCVGGCHSPSD